MSLLACIGIGLAVWFVFTVFACWIDGYGPEGGSVVTLFLFPFLAWLLLAPETEASKANRQAREAREQAERTPHVIREADGCKVYAFKSEGRYHYFTRCGANTVPTLTTHTESCGKSCTRTFTEEIK